MGLALAGQCLLKALQQPAGVGRGTQQVRGFSYPSRIPISMPRGTIAFQASNDLSAAANRAVAASAPYRRKSTALIATGGVRYLTEARAVT